MKKWITWICLLCPIVTAGQTISVSGTPWAVTLTYPFTSVTSPDPQVLIAVKTEKDMNYLVTVQRDALNWHDELVLYIRRTGDGSGNPAYPPIGGTSWVEINTVPRDFFWGGDKNRNNIPCQYMLDPGWPAEGAYSTTVTFTIIEI
jgi:hypothetical protein